MRIGGIDLSDKLKALFKPQSLKALRNLVNFQQKQMKKSAEEKEEQRFSSTPTSGEGVLIPRGGHIEARVRIPPGFTFHSDPDNNRATRQAYEEVANEISKAEIMNFTSTYHLDEVRLLSSGTEVPRVERYPIGHKFAGKPVPRNCLGPGLMEMVDNHLNQAEKEEKS